MLSGQETGNYCYGAFHLLPSTPCGTIPCGLITYSSNADAAPKHYIIWLLVSVLLAVKAFASPVSDAFAVRQLLFPLLRRRSLCSYLKRSVKLKQRLLIHNPTVNLLSPVVWIA